MLEEVGVIVAIEKKGGVQNFVVETEIKTTCNACQVQSSCGTSVIAKAFSSKTQRLNFESTLAAEVGQKIKIGIPEERLLTASVLVYMLPLFGLIVGAILAQSILPLLSIHSELWVVASAFLMATAVFSAVRWYIAHQKYEHFCPQLLAVLPKEAGVIDIKQL